MKANGVSKGDVVTIYMSMVPELAMVMLACARIGAIHSVVFAGFSAESLRDRIENCNSKWLFVCDEGKRGGKSIPLKETADAVTKHTYIYLFFALTNSMLVSETPGCRKPCVRTARFCFPANGSECCYACWSGHLDARTPSQGS